MNATWSCLVVLMALSMPANSGTSDSAVSDPKRFALELLQRYSPHGFAIVTTYENLPTEIVVPGGRLRFSKTDFGTYIRGVSTLDVATSLNTVVHEICHGYTHARALADADLHGGKSRAFYSDRGEPVIVGTTRVFRTREMASRVPPSLRSMRYEQYIASDSVLLGAQTDGVYGLLDEWNAYYQGTRTAVDLEAFFREALPAKPEVWLKYFQEVYGTDYAYVEFKYFILEYLRYAKDQAPEIYRGIRDNAAFKAVYNRVDRDFAELIRRQESLTTELFAFLSRHGMSAWWDGDWIRIRQSSSDVIRGVGTFRDEYRRFAAALEAPELIEIHRDIANGI